MLKDEEPRHPPGLQELRWLYEHRDLPGAHRDLGAGLAARSGKYPKLASWVEESIDETLTFYRLPCQHHKHLKSTDEVDKRIFCRRCNVSVRGRSRGEERGIGRKFRRAA